MGGNLAMVRFECEQEPLNRVVAYLQEKPINICTQGPERPHMECSWERFNYQFQEAIRCPYDEVCGNMNWDLISIFGELIHTIVGKCQNILIKCTIQIEDECTALRRNGSTSLNPIKVTKFSGFSLGLTTRWSLKAILAGYEAGPLGITTLTVAISLHKGRNLRPLNTRSLCSTKKSPSWRFWPLNTDWPLYP